MPDDERQDRPYQVLIAARDLCLGALAVIATLVALRVIDRAGQVFAILAMAATVAVLAAPLVDLLARLLPRAAALVVATGGGILGVIAVAGVVSWDLNRQAGDLSRAVAEAVDRLPAGSTAADAAGRLQVTTRFDDLLDRLRAAVIQTSDPIATAGLVGRLVVIAVLAAFIIVSGRELAGAAIAMVRRASIRERFNQALDTSVSRGGAFVRRSLAVSLCHGLAAGAFCHFSGLPGSISLATWVMMMTMLPVLGGIIAWAPIVTIATVTAAPWQVAVATGAVAVALDVVARRRWARSALPLGPLLSIVGLALGVSTIGVPGGVVGLLAVAIGAAIVRSDDAQVPAALSDLVDDPPIRSVPAAADDPAALEPVKAEVRPSAEYLRVAVSRRTALALMALVIALYATVRVITETNGVLVWFAVGAFIAAGLDRPISAMRARWRLPRPAGIAVVVTALAALVTTVVVAAGPSITESAQSVADDAPETVRSLESLPIIGGMIRRADTAEKVEQWIREIPDRVQESELLERVVALAGDGLIGVMWMLAILFAILIDGPRLVDAARRRIPPERRRGAIRLGRAAYLAVSNVVAASAFVAALNGTVVMLLALALGVPLAPLLGLWAAFWNFIPQIGGFVGAVPLVGLAFTQGPWTGVIALVSFVTYQSFENHVIQPVVGSRAVHVPPLVLLVGALFGGALAGFVGALIASPTIGVAKVALDERRDRMGARIEDREPLAPPAPRPAPPAQAQAGQ